ncbi:MAG: carboxypeptidase-like regulatory domain-containing protein [Bacteroidota bacterium]
MKKLILVGVLLSTALGMAQTNGSLKGKVWDLELKDEPLLFANVQLKDTSWSTQTNFNGNFEITDVLPGTYILSIDFLGYENREIPIEIKENGITRIEEGLRAKSVPGIARESKGLAQTQKSSTSRLTTMGLRD